MKNSGSNSPSSHSACGYNKTFGIRYKTSNGKLRFRTFITKPSQNAGPKNQQHHHRLLFPFCEIMHGQIPLHSKSSCVPTYEEIGTYRIDGGSPHINSHIVHVLFIIMFTLFFFFNNKKIQYNTHIPIIYITFSFIITPHYVAQQQQNGTSGAHAEHTATTPTFSHNLWQWRRKKG